VGSLADRLSGMAVSEGVIPEDYVPAGRLWSLMGACDAIVSPRSPRIRQNSGAAIRALALGKPLVVSDVGWFSELPDDVAIRVPVGGDEEVQALAAALRRLPRPPAAGGGG